MWDNLNHYQFEEFLKYKDQLAESERCKELLSEIERVKDIEYSRAFCEEADLEITVQTYMNNLKKIEAK